MSGKGLDQQRQEELEPERVHYAITKINALGYEITYQSKTRIEFWFKGKTVKFYPYSGWHTGKTIKDGRGINKLLKQINV